MAHRVIVWGTGFVGKMVIRELLDHPEFELVGVIVNDPESAALGQSSDCSQASGDLRSRARVTVPGFRMASRAASPR
jgi:uncharacterized protein YbjT (DUF2867 family)